MSPLRQASLLEVNEFLVLDYVRERGRTTRARIAADLGLSSASVSRIVKRLLQQGTVTESVATATPVPGRPPSVIGFNRARGTVIAIDLGGPERPLSWIDVDDCARGLLALADRPEALWMLAL